MRTHFSKRLAGLSVLGLFLFVHPAWAVAIGPAKFLDVQGEVKVKGPTEKDWKPAAKGDWVEQGSEVSTASDASCTIALGNGRKSVIQLNPGSTSVLTSLGPDVRVDLRDGRLYSLVHGLDRNSKFEVATPTAIAVARGTGWEQSLNAVNVMENSVAVSGSDGQEKEIPEGKGVEVGGDGSLGETYDVPEDAKENWKDFETKAEDLVKQDSGEGTANYVESDPNRMTVGAPPDQNGTPEESEPDRFGDDEENFLGDHEGGVHDVLGEAKEHAEESQGDQEIEDQLKPDEGNGGQGGYITSGGA